MAGCGQPSGHNLFYRSTEFCKGRQRVLFLCPCRLTFIHCPCILLSLHIWMFWPLIGKTVEPSFYCLVSWMVDDLIDSAWKDWPPDIWSDSQEGWQQPGCRHSIEFLWAWDPASSWSSPWAQVRSVTWAYHQDHLWAQVESVIRAYHQAHLWTQVRSVTRAYRQAPLPVFSLKWMMCW